MNDFFRELEMLDKEQERFDACKAAEKASEMDAELQELDAMSERDACLLYNVDSKAEARQYIKDYYQQTA